MKKSDYLSMLASCVTCLTLAACNSAQRGAEAAVRENLKDPESARFGELYFNKKTQKGCLTVSAKNSFGGYTEEQEAFLIRNEDDWTVDDIANVAHQGCVLAFADKQG